jgi:peroxisome-assembly ATPase
LERLYGNLKDYEPYVDYKFRLDQINAALKSNGPTQSTNLPPRRRHGPGFWKSVFLGRNASTSEIFALARVLTLHEAAMQVQSPKGLLLHGEVGTGKSMLIDLFAGCLPTKRKRRWHYNTFMLQIISRLEQYRRERWSSVSGEAADYSLLKLARNLIQYSPILFIDEFQLPDRMSAKMISNLMTIFFRLGGVLIATSNRLPDELAKAAGLPVTSRQSTLEKSASKRFLHSSSLLPANREFADFLDLLKVRCDVWEIRGETDYRRQDLETIRAAGNAEAESKTQETVNINSAVEGESTDKSDVKSTSPSVPTYYFLHPMSENTESTRSSQQDEIMERGFELLPQLANKCFSPSCVQVFGRSVQIPRTCNGTSVWTFEELCIERYGPADYITMASHFHTTVIIGVPILTISLKNEARRFITLLDALYEAGCKLTISAEAAPDGLFFPDLKLLNKEGNDLLGRLSSEVSVQQDDALHAETFAEVHQDLTSPFRPNVSSYLSTDALEDDPPNRIRREALPGLTEMERMERLDLYPNFAHTSYFTGEDEKFAYKRAISRLYEMCGDLWWNTREWSPLPIEQRHWEKSNSSVNLPSASTADEAKSETSEGMDGSGVVDDISNTEIFKHGASPFRTQPGPAPRIREEHMWGVTKWGKKAGAWGQGVEGFQDRHKRR